MVNIPDAVAAMVSATRGQGHMIAMRNGLSISGIAGEIYRAAQRHIISSEDAIEKLGQLLVKKRINKNVYEEILARL